MSDYTPDTETVRYYATYGKGVSVDDFDRWLELERFKSRQDGYALRIADERDGIGADPDEWLEAPKENVDG